MTHTRKLSGNRFEAFYSISRQYADIIDRKRRGILMMLTWEEVDALRTRLRGVAEEHKDKPGQVTPFNVAYPKTNSKIVGLNYEDTVELGDLAELLMTILIPTIA